jgi:hypothetical protein
MDLRRKYLPSRPLDTMHVYLGVTRTPTLDCEPKLQLQKREVAFLGARVDGLPIEMAARMWQAYVEPKFAYACGTWMPSSNEKAHTAVNRIQKQGAALTTQSAARHHVCAALL